MDPVQWKSLWQIVRAIGKPEGEASIDPVQEQIVREALLEILPSLRGRERFSIAKELAWLWRIPLLPLAMNPRFKREWDLFLALEVGYFYPLRKGKRLPGNPGQIGVLLADRGYLSLVVADGDALAAEPLLGARFDEFWRAVIPQACVVPYSTVRHRIDRGLQLLASSLNRWRSSCPGAAVSSGEPFSDKRTGEPARVRFDALGPPSGSW